MESVPPPNFYPEGSWSLEGEGLRPEPHDWPAARTETQTLPFKAEATSEDIKPAI